MDSSSCRNVLIMNLVNIVNRTGKSSLEKFFFKRSFGNPDLTTSVFQIWTDTDKSSPLLPDFSIKTRSIRLIRGPKIRNFHPFLHLWTNADSGSVLRCIRLCPHPVPFLSTPVIHCPLLLRPFLSISESVFVLSTARFCP